ncbi:MAG: adenylyl-sulfate kinase, partial [Verrucomicrobia bacterium]|nr:adenylyl-sulfate kinase [Verrucomicrobiota bacterium]
MSSLENIHPTFGQLLGRKAKETLLKQRGLVVWLYGLSGSGKST